MKNVTEEVLNRKMVEEKNEELEAVIENMIDEVVIFDKDFNIIKSDRRVEENFIIDHPYLNNLSHMMENTIAFDKNNELISYGNFPFQRTARGEVVVEGLMKIQSGSGISYREVSGSPIYDKDGNFSLGVMTYRDVGDRMKLEESKLIKAQNELLIKKI